jgi:hypothetical protein
MNYTDSKILLVEEQPTYFQDNTKYLIIQAIIYALIFVFLKILFKSFTYLKFRFKYIFKKKN